MSKVYAYQISPEWQESPLFRFDEWPDDLAVCGNRDYYDHVPEVFERVWNVLNDGGLAEILENIAGEWEEAWYTNAADAINDMLYPEKPEYSENDIKEIERLVLSYGEYSGTDDDILCSVLSIVTGKEWIHKEIRGYNQGEWQNVYYVSEIWTQKLIDDFETGYFNMGSEWIIHDDDTTPESPGDIMGYSIYCHSYDIDCIREEIAAYVGEKPENVVLWEHVGYHQVSDYKLA